MTNHKKMNIDGIEVGAVGAMTIIESGEVPGFQIAVRYRIGIEVPHAPDWRRR